MTHSRVIDRSDARDKLLQGAATLADAVRTTLGPRARCVLIERSGRRSFVSDDGLTIARAIAPADRLEALGARALREAAEQTGHAVGDGTATAIVLAYATLAGGARLIAAGASPMDLKRGLERAAREADRALGALTRQLSGEDELRAVATTAARNDAELGAMAADAAICAGPDGTVEVHEDAAPDGACVSPKDPHSANVVVLHIGDASTSAMCCHREAARHAVGSALAALKAGVVPGAGVALVRAIPAAEAEADRCPGDERAGALLLAQALAAPAHQLARNAGVDGGIVVRRLRAGTGSFGFDAAAGRFTDLMERGVIDASLVLRVALRNAVAVAADLLLADTLVIAHEGRTGSRRAATAAAAPRRHRLNE